MKPARIEDIRKYANIQDNTYTYIYLVNGVWMLERQVVKLITTTQR